MKALALLLGVLLFGMSLAAAEPKGQAQAAVIPEPPRSEGEFKIERIDLSGRFERDNATFRAQFKVKAEGPCSLEVAGGAVAELSSEVKGGAGMLWWSKDAKFKLRDGGYWLECPDKGEYDVSFEFSSKVSESSGIRSCSFRLAPALIRAMEIEVDAKEVELDVPGSLGLKRVADGASGKSSIFAATLPSDGAFSATWKRFVEREKTGLVASADAAMVFEVFPGTVRIDANYTFNVIQGKLTELKIGMPSEVNVLNVSGQSIQDWQISKSPAGSVLTVKLSREFESQYALRVEAERVLAEFPCTFSLPAMNPLDVLKLDGTLAFGTSRAIRLICEKVEGLNQVDNRAFPLVKRQGSALPSRSLYTYQFSGGKWSLESKADNISPSCSMDMNCVMTVKDEDLTVKAMMELDVKDAPLKELLIKYSPDLTVGRVEGPCVNPGDYELLKRGSDKVLRIPLKPETIGKTSLVILLDRSIKDSPSFDIPDIQAEGMKGARGYLMLAAGRGLSLQPSDLKSLKEVHIGSAPVKEPGLQFVFRFKDESWGGRLSVKREKTSIVSEVFHLASIGEGAVYCSSMFSCHISGAPTDRISFLVEPSMKNLEFTGRDIVDWKRLKEAGAGGRETWQLSLREKILGDITVLSTYELPLQGGEPSVRLGGMAISGADSESGYIAVCSQRNLDVSAKSLPEEAVRLAEPSELPAEYRKMVTNPIIKVWRCLKSPHWADVSVKPYSTERLLDVVVDFANLRTRIDRNGETQTNADYRIKNSSLQFLSLRLPEGSKLWTLSVDGEERRPSVSEGSLLVPLPRRQDINVPIAVSLRYTQKFAPLESWAGFSLGAPSLQSESMLCKWTVEAPDDYCFSSTGGNMEADTPIQTAGFGGFISMLLSILKESYMSLALPFALMTLGLAFVSFSASLEGRSKAALLALGLLLTASSLLAGYLAMSCACGGPAPLGRSEAFAVNQVDFSRSFFLPKETPKAEFSLEDMRGYGSMKMLRAGVCWLLAAACAVFAFKAGGVPKRALLAAASATLLLAGGAQWMHFNNIAAPVMALILPSVLAAGVLASLLKLGARHFVKAAVAASVFAIISGVSVAGEGVSFTDVSCKIFVAEKSVAALGEWLVKSDGEALLPLIGQPSAVSKRIGDDNDDVELVKSGEAYFLKVKRAGEFKFEAEFMLPFKKDSGNILFELPLPPSLRNRVEVGTDREFMEIVSPNAVQFSNELSGKFWKARASFAPGARAKFVLRPQQRNIEEEAVQFFAVVDGVARFVPGFVETAFLCNIQVAQGEALKFNVSVPANMRVTSVEAQDLGAWKADSAKGSLEIVLSRPHAGNYALTVVTQIGDCPLPSKTSVSTISFPEASKQHGSMGLFCDTAVQLQVLKSEGFSLINNSDFAPGQSRGGASLKKAYRFFKTPCELQVEATAVEPEIRVSERTALNYEEERASMSSSLDLDIAKAGVFSVQLKLPEGFDIDRLTGEGVQHWDEVSDAGRRKAVVNFVKRTIGPVSINIELSRMGRLKDGPATVPRIELLGAARLTGELSITVERGVRMDVLKRQGVESKPASLAKSFKSATHSFAIQRTDWLLDVSFSAAEPWVQVESLQTAKVTEGWADCEALFNCSIENAGVKKFRLSIPAKAEAVEFFGQGLVSFASPSAGLWEVELGQKTGREYRLSCRYRIPYDGKRMSLSPASFLDVQNQTGYYAIFSEDSGEARLVAKEGDATEFDARKIPPSFKTAPMGGATLCFRTVGSACRFDVEMLRHKVAETLQAEIKSVDLLSVATADGVLVTRAVVRLDNGNQNFLKVKLPQGGSLWSVFIDSQPVEAAKEGPSVMLVPLRQGFGGRRSQSVEFTYSLSPGKGWTSGRQSYIGPSFDLPLQNVSWTLTLPPSSRYSGFKGTLDYVKEPFLRMVAPENSTIELYDNYNKSLLSEKLNKAKGLLDQGNSLSKQGRQAEAFEAFQSALNLSENDFGLNSDIQGQWLEQQRSQNVQSIANRRGGVNKKMLQQKLSEVNVAPAFNQPVAQQAMPQQFDSLDDVKAQIGGVELKSLQAISDKIFMQQRAATVVPHPLSITIPERGVSVRFERALQATPDAVMEVSFEATRNFEWRSATVLIAGIGLALAAFVGFLFFGLALRRARA